jgi:heme A synthase
MAVSTIDRTSKEQNAHSTPWWLMPGLALAALISTILLIAMGSIVRVTGYGLGCPDWPLCYGQVIPPALTGAWVEFTHRLLGGFASLQIVLLGVFAWRRYRSEPWVFRPAMAAVGLLVIQIGLGGLHVIFEIPPTTGLIHTGAAMLIVGLVAVQVVSTWPATPSFQAAGQAILRNKRFVTWVSVTGVVTYLLLLTGSYVTRSGASLACPSFPLCGVDGSNALITIQMLHRYVAYTVTVLTLVMVVWLIVRQNDPRLVRLAYGVGALLLIQLGLGMTNVLLRLPMWSRVLHLTVAATLWAGVVVVWSLCCVRQLTPTR